MEDEKQWLETILKKRAFEESPLSVTDYTSSEAVGKNQNYMSKLVRLEVTTVLGSGKKKKIKVLVKNRPAGQFLGPFVTRLGLFVREITMYRDILPKMENLMEEIGDYEEPLWAKCYDYRLYDRLVLEDLSVYGYKMASRKDQLTLDAALLLTKNIAKYHGLSHVLMKRGELPTDLFDRSPWDKHREMYKHQCDKCFMNLLEGMDTWGGEWKDVQDKFEKAIPTLSTKSLNLTVPEADSFVVLNHGDCWTNNFLFRFDNESDTPRSTKFVDFQLSFLGPPSYDLHYLLSASVPPEITDEYFDQIIETYCVNLKSTLEPFNLSEQAPDFNQMKTLMEKTHVWRLLNAIFLTPVILGDSEDIPDIEESFRLEMEAMQRGESANAWNVHRDLKERARKVIQWALRDATDRHII